MYHFLEPFDFDRMQIRVEAQIDSIYEVVEDLYVFKVGELGHKDVDITDALTKDERSALEELALEDYRECEVKNESEDPLLITKQNKEWKMAGGS